MFLIWFRANKYTNQVLCFLTVYVYFFLVVGSVVGLCAVSVLCLVGWVGFFFQLFCYLIRAGTHFLCTQIDFCCSLVWFWTHWGTARTAAACSFCAHDPAASKVNIRGDYGRTRVMARHKSNDIIPNLN